METECGFDCPIQIYLKELKPLSHHLTIFNSRIFASSQVVRFQLSPSDVFFFPTLQTLRTNLLLRLSLICTKRNPESILKEAGERCFTIYGNKLIEWKLMLIILISLNENITLQLETGNRVAASLLSLHFKRLQHICFCISLITYAQL